MYILILIVSFIANGAAVDIDHVKFSNKSDCQEALIEILKDNRDSTDGLSVKGYCVRDGYGI